MPSEFATDSVALATELATEADALLTAFMDVLMADVTEFVAVEAGGSSIAGIEGRVPDVKKVLPVKKI